MGKKMLTVLFVLIVLSCSQVYCGNGKFTHEDCKQFHLYHAHSGLCIGTNGNQNLLKPMNCGEFNNFNSKTFWSAKKKSWKKWFLEKKHYAWVIFSRYSGNNDWYAMDVKGDTKDKGARIQAYKKHEKSNQQWTLEFCHYLRGESIYLIKSRKSGKCIDNTAAEVDGYWQWDCNCSNENQQFKIKINGNSPC